MIPLKEPAFDEEAHRAEGSIDKTAVKALTRVMKAWRLAAGDAAKLSGVSERTWARLKSEEWSGTLTQDQKMRASAIVGIYKGLHLYFGDELADKWPKMPNTGPLFAGAPPVKYMEEGGLPAMLSTRQYIDAIRGGM